MNESLASQPPQPKAEGYNLAFEKKQHKVNVVLYIFDQVAVAIDTSGKNYKELPEILFGTFEKEYITGSMSQPKEKMEGVDMNYITACIGEVARDSGISKFWLYPFGDDNPENKKRRENARAKLFSRYANLTPEPSGFGYILEI